MNELVKSNLYLIHMDDELYHHGIKGMKWGVRRYQNPDGTLTEEGKKRKRRRLIAAGVIIAGAAALTIGAIAAGSASRNLNAGRKIMADENVRNTTVSNIGKYNGRFLFSDGGFGMWFNGGMNREVRAKLKDGRVIKKLKVAAPASMGGRWSGAIGRKVKKNYNSTIGPKANKKKHKGFRYFSQIMDKKKPIPDKDRIFRGDGKSGTAIVFRSTPLRSSWTAFSKKAKTRDGRVLNNLYVTAPWSTTARSTGRKVKPDRYIGLNVPKKK